MFRGLLLRRSKFPLRTGCTSEWGNFFNPTELITRIEPRTLTWSPPKLATSEHPGCFRAGHLDPVGRAGGVRLTQTRTGLINGSGKGTASAVPLRTPKNAGFSVCVR